MGANAADIDRHVRSYLLVFFALMVLTVVTVGAWHFLKLGAVATVAVALLIASVKAALVACVFMHLISEKKLVYWVLAVTVVFFLVLLIVPYLTSLLDQVQS